MLFTRRKTSSTEKRSTDEESSSRSPKTGPAVPLDPDPEVILDPGAVPGADREVVLEAERTLDQEANQPRAKAERDPDPSREDPSPEEIGKNQDQKVDREAEADQGDRSPVPNPDK